MARRRHDRAFTLVELLVVVAIVGVLMSILVPSLGSVRALGRSTACLGNLNALGRAMGQYHVDNKDTFWPCTLNNHPQQGMVTYFWGTRSDPVDPRPSPFMEYCDWRLDYFWCPSMKWGSYVPQGVSSQPTTTYSYNAWCLDPASYKGGKQKAKSVIQLPQPGEIFVFNDGAILLGVGDNAVFQNSTHMEPVTGAGKVTPTTHFRHRGQSNALCADGHAKSFGLEDGQMLEPAHSLGFVGSSNVPHYDLRDY